MPESGSTVEQKLQSLRKSFVDSSLQAMIDDVVSRTETLIDNPSSEPCSEDFTAFDQATRRLVGSAGTFGLSEISEVARGLWEEVSGPEGSGRLPPPPNWDEVRIKLGNLTRLAVSEINAEKTRQLSPLPAELPAPEVKAAVRRVVVAQSEPGEIEHVKTDLETFGFEVAVADRAEAVSAALRDLSPVALVVELGFGGFDTGGADVVAGLRGAGNIACPVVFLSARGDLESRLAAVRAGCDAYMVEPVSGFALVDVLDRLTGVEEAEPYRVLIVDDDPDVARHMEIVLRSAGMITATVTDPASIMGALDAFVPEIILLDIYMPRCGGQELAEVIRQQESFVGTPIIFLSAETDPDTQIAALSHGGDDFLTKPVIPEHLVTSVKTRGRRYRILRSRMVRDSLTGLINHSTTKQMLDTEIERARRNKAPLAFVMLDIDHFKAVNDNHGHGVGDQVIRSMAHLLRQRLRSIDVIGRMGGEEFGLVLIGTAADEAFMVADQIREAFSDITHRAGENSFTVTVSCGVAAFPTHDTGATLIEAADRALYEAKNSGRNLVVQT